ncbi:MAG: PAS domain S-box protein [Anaerolineae bacterium]|jgi:PAS domain S-box-containing protein
MDKEPQLYRILLQHATDLISVVDADGNLRYASPSHRTTLGYEPGELVDRPMFDLVHPDDVQAARESLAGALGRPGAVGQATFRFRHKDGSWRWLESTGRNLLHDPSVGGVLANSRDVTARIAAETELRESQARFKAQYKGLPLPIYTWQRVADDFELIDYNHAADEITGGRVAHLLGRRASELYADTPHIPQEMWSCYREQRSMRREMLYEFQSIPEARNMSVSYAFVPPDLVLVHTEDITERIEAEEALRTLQEELEARVAARTAALRQANEALKAEIAWRERAQRESQRAERALNERERQLREMYAQMEDKVVARTHEIEQRRRVAESLRGMLTVLNSDLPPDEVLEHIVAEASRLLDSDASAIYRSRGAAGGFCAQTVQGPAAHEIGSDDLPPELSRMLAAGRLVLVPDAMTAPGDVPSPAFLERMAVCCRALLAVPLIVKGEVYGGLALYYTRPRTVSGEEIDLAVAFADQAALAIENARLHQQAREAAVMDERARLARELHDSVTQALFSITLLAEAGQRLGAAGDMDRVITYLGRLGEMSQQSLKEMRLLVYELRPLALQSERLVGALQQRLDAVEARAGVTARLLVEGNIEVLPTVEEELYRIAEQALNNALKHAEATETVIHIRAGEGHLSIEVRDNGKGFCPAEVVDRGGQGLTSMRERAARIGGVLVVDSAPGQGTTVRLEIESLDRHNQGR